VISSLRSVFGAVAMRIAAVLILAVPAAHAMACTQKTNSVECQLLTVSENGGLPMVVPVPAGQHLVLTNNGASWVQINQVAASTGEQTFWSEYCVYRDDYSGTGQAGPPGVGEVGCTFKNVGENYPTIQWEGTLTALSVPPHTTLYINAHTDPSSVAHTYTISAYPQSRGVDAYRFPQMDQIFTCTGSTQQTNWTPRRNTSGANWYVSGATVYADGGGGTNAATNVQAACAYILDTVGAVRWSYCAAPMKSRGFFSFPTQTVAPGESLVAQAAHSCSPSALAWGYAAWLHVSY
jgi:hypothetical protein